MLSCLVKHSIRTRLRFSGIETAIPTYYRLNYIYTIELIVLVLIQKTKKQKKKI